MRAVLLLGATPAADPRLATVPMEDRGGTPPPAPVAFGREWLRSRAP